MSSIERYECPVCKQSVGVRVATGLYYKHKFDGSHCAGGGTKCHHYTICNDYQPCYWFVPCYCNRCYDKSMEREYARLAEKDD